MSVTLRALKGLSDIADGFDGFILDLWGVVHDGAQAYPQSADTLRALKAAGKKTILLSNAPRRGYVLIEAMTRMGIARELYGDVLSSGEATREAFIARSDPFFAALGSRAFHLGPDRDRSIFDDTGLSVVDRVSDADFIANTGPDGLDEVVEDYEATLQEARSRDLPMVCANPDLVVIRAGKPLVCAGAIAKRYEDLGGRVAYRGKPDPAVYHLAVSKLDLPDKRRIAVIGDALETDVKGAAASGLQAIWCTGGIHAEVLGTCYGVAADPAKALELARTEGQNPSFSIPGFIW